MTYVTNYCYRNINIYLTVFIQRPQMNIVNKRYMILGVPVHAVPVLGEGHGVNQGVYLRHHLNKTYVCIPIYLISYLFGIRSGETIAYKVILNINH